MTGYIFNNSRRTMLSHILRMQRRCGSSLSSIGRRGAVDLQSSLQRPRLVAYQYSCSRYNNSNAFSTLLPPSPSTPDFNELSRQATAIIGSNYLQKEDAEMDAALFLDSTSAPEVLARASISDDAGQEHDSEFSKLLHRAFLHLTAKNLSHSSPTMAMELARRAHQFGLCFHLPLYEQLILTVATHYNSSPVVNLDGTKRPVEIILEMSALAFQSLQVVLEGPFVRTTLVALVKRNLINDALVLLSAMKDRHDIHILPHNITIQLLSVLRDQVQQEQAQAQAALQLNNNDNDDDASTSISTTNDTRMLMNKSDASELMMTLHTMLMDDEYDDDDETRPEIMLPNSNDGDLMESLTDILDEYDTIDDDAFGTTSAEEDDHFFDMLDMEPAEIRAAMADYLQQRDDWSDEGQQQDDDDDQFTGAQAADTTTMTTTALHQQQEMPFYGTNTAILNRHHDDIMKEAIYLRDASAWKLPDVTEQLNALAASGTGTAEGSEVLYTHAYEEQLLSEMLAAETD